MEILYVVILLAVFVIVSLISGKIRDLKEDRKERRRAKFEHKARG